MEELADAQARLRAELDPMLPVLPAPSNPPVTARLPDGTAVRCDVYRARYGPDAVQRLWLPRLVWEATPLLGDTGEAGMAAVLAALRRWFDTEVPAEESRSTDTAIELYWPSRDIDVAAALYRHGFVPMSALAVRVGTPVSAPGRNAVTVRRATLSDLDELVTLRLEELRYSLRVIGGRMRDNAADLLAASMRHATYFDGRVLLAESGGVAVGVAECGLATASESIWIQHRLPRGQWGYIGTLSVLPSARGTGVGGTLVDAAHRMLDADAERGTFLFYDLANPLSTVFWPRKGYRPLWTKWVCKPAGLLR